MVDSTAPLCPSRKPWLAAIVSDLLPSRSRTGENRASQGRREPRYWGISGRPRTPRGDGSQPQPHHDAATRHRWTSRRAGAWNQSSRLAAMSAMRETMETQPALLRELLTDAGPCEAAAERIRGRRVL